MLKYCCFVTKINKVFFHQEIIPGEEKIKATVKPKAVMAAEAGVETLAEAKDKAVGKTKVATEDKTKEVVMEVAIVMVAHHLVEEEAAAVVLCVEVCLLLLCCLFTLFVYFYSTGLFTFTLLNVGFSNQN